MRGLNCSPSASWWARLPRRVIRPRPRPRRSARARVNAASRFQKTSRAFDARIERYPRAERARARARARCVRRTKSAAGLGASAVLFRRDFLGSCRVYFLPNYLPVRKKRTRTTRRASRWPCLADSAHPRGHERFAALTGSPDFAFRSPFRASLSTISLPVRRADDARVTEEGATRVRRL